MLEQYVCGYDSAVPEDHTGGTYPAILFPFSMELSVSITSGRKPLCEVHGHLMGRHTVRISLSGYLVNLSVHV